MAGPIEFPEPEPVVFFANVAELGQATLIIELRDSMSNEILVRAADRRAAASAGWAIEVNSVTVWPEVRRLASAWGRRIVKGLEDFESIDDLAPRR